MKKVIIYSKDYCPYCHSAKKLLKKKGYAYKNIEVEGNPRAFKQMVKKSSGRITVPQIFLGEQHIGGYDDLCAYFKSRS